jgi:hypothetical protein
MTLRDFSICQKGYMLKMAEHWKIARRVAFYVCNSMGAKIPNERNLFSTFDEAISGSSHEWTEERISNSINRLLHGIN